MLAAAFFPLLSILAMLPVHTRYVPHALNAPVLAILPVPAMPSVPVMPIP